MLPGWWLFLATVFAGLFGPMAVAQTDSTRSRNLRDLSYKERRQLPFAPANPADHKSRALGIHFFGPATGQLSMTYLQGLPKAFALGATAGYIGLPMGRGKDFTGGLCSVSGRMYTGNYDTALAPLNGFFGGITVGYSFFQGSYSGMTSFWDPRTGQLYQQDFSLTRAYHNAYLTLDFGGTIRIRNVAFIDLSCGMGYGFSSSQVLDSFNVPPGSVSDYNALPEQQGYAFSHAVLSPQVPIAFRGSVVLGILLR
jgi:hypothetical protein